MSDKNILKLWQQKLYDERKDSMTRFPNALLREQVAQLMCNKIINIMGNGDYKMRLIDGRDTALIEFEVTEYPAVRADLCQEEIVYKIHAQHPALEVTRFFYQKSSDQFHIHICPRVPFKE